MLRALIAFLSASAFLFLVTATNAQEPSGLSDSQLEKLYDACKQEADDKKACEAFSAGEITAMAAGCGPCINGSQMCCWANDQGEGDCRGQSC